MDHIRPNILRARWISKLQTGHSLLISSMTLPQDETPVPGMDPIAAGRWRQRRHQTSPWLHEEVARRMVERLQWFRDPPDSWLHWEPVMGGLQAHQHLAQALPKAKSLVYLHDPTALSLVKQGTVGPRRGLLSFLKPESGPRLADAQSTAKMLWVNMFLHHVERPQALLKQWHAQVETGGFLMFSCLGPDSLSELRAVYAAQSWPAPTHAFTDMHDWGDMLVRGGFAEPVMDMERIVLTYSSPGALLDELRTLGRNLSSARFHGLRARSWRPRLEQAIERYGVRTEDGRWQLSVEVIFGHAFKAEPKKTNAKVQSLSIDEMRNMLRRGPKP